MVGPGFPDPDATFRRRSANPPPSPVVLSVPHAGVATTGFEGALAPTLDVRGDADLFVDRLYGVDAAAEAAPAAAVYVAANLSRFVCDMNRDSNDVSSAAVPGHPAPRNADARGFVWAVTTTGAPALARPLTLEEWRARQAVHAAYHRAISQAVAAAKACFGYALLVDGHSMPSVGRSGHRDPGRARADIVPGDRDGTSCSPALSRFVQKHFTAAGYTVSFNDPYKGGFITTHHGRPREDVHAIQIEVRRDLYMDEATFKAQPQGFSRLQMTLQRLIATLDGFRP